MSLPSLGSYSVAFSHWRHVQKQLIRMIQDYVGACATLHSALAVHPNDYSSRHLRAEAFAGLDSQLPFLASYEQSLKEARFSLKITRNASIPINSLPPEILGTIFIMAVWQEVDTVCAIAAITSVCKLWRQTTLECPSCWSRIELPIGPGEDWLAFNRALLWSKRAQNEPLHISVWERPNSEEDPWYSHDKTFRVVRFLGSLMPRVRTMEFLDDLLDLSSLVPATLACWVEHGTVGMAEVLRLRADIYGDPVQIMAKNISMEGNSTLDDFKSFFSSLRTLSLKGAKIDWRLGLYSGLVDLHLGHQFYSQWDIAAILGASPGLRSLTLLGFEIGVDGREDAPNAVALNDLHLLRLKSLGQNLWAVLRMITSTSDSIHVSLSFESHPEFIPAARSFFERCKVTALHISSQYYKSRPPISSLFVHMPHLQRLAIENHSIIDQTSQDSIPQPNSNSLDFWPRLDKLYLINCNLDQQTLPQLLSIHEPKDLWVCESGWDGQARDQAEERLRQCGVKLVWVENWDNMPAESRDFATGRFV